VQPAAEHEAEVHFLMRMRRMPRRRLVSGGSKDENPRHDGRRATGDGRRATGDGRRATDEAMLRLTC
jgi:hypothetical protein